MYNIKNSQNVGYKIKFYWIFLEKFVKIFKCMKTGRTNFIKKNLFLIVESLYLSLKDKILKFY